MIIKIISFRISYYFYLVLLFELVVSNNVTSSTIHVPEDYSSIQEAIDSAINATTILIAPGKYFENIRIQNKNIVLASKSDGQLDTIIDGNQKDSVVYIYNDFNYKVQISGISIVNGKSKNFGGGIYCSNGKVIIDNVTISDNIASLGAGIYIESDSESIISNSIIKNNYSYHDGGGAYLSTDMIKMIKVMISNNHASIEHNYGRGGGI